jgi:hypothetical protein
MCMTVSALLIFKENAECLGQLLIFLTASDLLIFREEAESFHIFLLSRCSPFFYRTCLAFLPEPELSNGSCITRVPNCAKYPWSLALPFIDSLQNFLWSFSFINEWVLWWILMNDAQHKCAITCLMHDQNKYALTSRSYIVILVVLGLYCQLFLVRNFLSMANQVL